MKAERKRERARGKNDSRWWFARVPDYPPTLPPQPHLPLPPIEIQVPEPSVLVCEELPDGDESLVEYEKLERGWWKDEKAIGS